MLSSFEKESDEREERERRVRERCWDPLIRKRDSERGIRGSFEREREREREYMLLVEREGGLKETEKRERGWNTWREREMLCSFERERREGTSEREMLGSFDKKETVREGSEAPLREREREREYMLLVEREGGLKETEKKRERLEYWEREKCYAPLRERGRGRERVRERCWDPLIRKRDSERGIRGSFEREREREREYMLLVEREGGLKETEKKREAGILGEREKCYAPLRERGRGRERVRERCWDPLIRKRDSERGIRGSFEREREREREYMLLVSFEKDREIIGSFERKWR
ncbi:Double-Stranded Rna-Binding Protein Staufen-like 1, partial [Manis pentadactyla]